MKSFQKFFSIDEFNDRRSKNGRTHSLTLLLSILLLCSIATVFIVGILNFHIVLPTEKQIFIDESAYTNSSIVLDVVPQVVGIFAALYFLVSRRNFNFSKNLWILLYFVLPLSIFNLVFGAVLASPNKPLGVSGAAAFTCFHLFSIFIFSLLFFVLFFPNRRNAYFFAVIIFLFVMTILGFVLRITTLIILISILNGNFGSQLIYSFVNSNIAGTFFIFFGFSIFVFTCWWLDFFHSKLVMRGIRK